jgi:cytochrome d ubiquinol oxidase subunit I
MTSDATEREICVRAMKVIGAIAVVTIVLSGLTGSNQMATLLSGQPLKYAALDANVQGGTNQPERLFGSVVDGAFQGGFTVPGMQSFLAQFETGVSSLPGLNQFPSSQWPPLLVHTTFNVMIVGGIASGVFLLAYFISLLMRRRPFESRVFSLLWIPMAFVALVVYELGWATDEVGRQPWIVYNVMTVQQAANVSQSLLVPGIIIVLFYLVVIPATFYVYARVYRAGENSDGGAGH